MNIYRLLVLDFLFFFLRVFFLLDFLLVFLGFFGVGTTTIGSLIVSIFSPIVSIFSGCSDDCVDPESDFADTIDNCGTCDDIDWNDCDTAVIDLHDNANLSSFYTLPEDTSVQNIFADVTSNLLAVASASSAALYNDDQWSGSLTDLALPLKIIASGLMISIFILLRFSEHFFTLLNCLFNTSY